MRPPPRVQVSTLRVTLALLAVCAVAACSGGAAQAEDGPFFIEISQTYVTVENRTGSPIVEGEVSIVPVGILPPFTARLPRLDVGGETTLLLNTFRGSGGPFNRNIANARTVMVTATSQQGEVYEHEAPFN